MQVIYSFMIAMCKPSQTDWLLSETARLKDFQGCCYFGVGSAPPGLLWTLWGFCSGTPCWWSQLMWLMYKCCPQKCYPAVFFYLTQIFVMLCIRWYRLKQPVAEIVRNDWHLIQPNLRTSEMASGNPFSPSPQLQKNEVCARNTSKTPFFAKYFNTLQHVSLFQAKIFVLSGCYTNKIEWQNWK